MWNRYCMIHLSIICGGRTIPFLWKVMKYKSSTMTFREYKLMLRLSPQLLSKYPDVMLLADRGFANHQLMNWLKISQCHVLTLWRKYSWSEKASYWIEVSLSTKALINSVNASITYWKLKHKKADEFIAHKASLKFV